MSSSAVIVMDYYKRARDALYIQLIWKKKFKSKGKTIQYEITSNTKPVAHLG